MSETLATVSIFFLFFTMFCSQSVARRENPSSLVFGMTHSGTLNAPKVASGAMRMQLDADSIEPMKEVRDGYLISLNLGTPSQIVQVYMDTGSDLTWVPCGNLSFNCIDCDAYFRTNKLVGGFSPFSSSTSIRVPCGSSFCSEIHSSDTSFDPCTMAGCSLTVLLKGTCLRPCPSFAYTYDEGGVITGALAKDALQIPGIGPNAVTEFPKFRFGCVGSAYREPLGIAGFGRGLLSLPSQLGFLQKGFSHCFASFKYSNNPNVSSPLIIGDLAINSPNDTYQFTPLLTNPIYPNYYYIDLEAVTVGNQTTSELPSSIREFNLKGDGGMVIDSGTTYTHLPEPFYSDLLLDVRSAVPYPRATDQEEQTSFDLCYEVPCPNNTCMLNGDHEYGDQLPTITFHFSGNASVVLPRGNSFYAVSPPSNSSIVKCFLYREMDDGEFGPAAVFGSFQQQNVEVVYDLERARIGFKQVDCVAFADSLGLHKS